MGFISLLFMGIYALIMLVGLVGIITAIIIFIVRAIRKKSHKVGVASKVVAIVLLTLGILCEIPAVILVVVSEIPTQDVQEEYQNLKKKYQLDTDALKDEFTYKGKTLVYVKALNADLCDDSDGTLEANLIFKNSEEDHTYESLYKVKSESPYEIYWIDSSEQIYVQKKDKAKAMDFYQTKAHYRVSMSCYHSNTIDKDYPVDKAKLDKMTKDKKDKTYKTSDIKDDYWMYVESKDLINTAEYTFLAMKDGSIVCCDGYDILDEEKEVQGLMITGKDASYIKGFMNKKEKEKKG